jgi:hypothetical protein
MGWTWTYSDSDGQSVSGLGNARRLPEPSRCGVLARENFRALLNEGVDKVTLLEDGAIAYTMSLHPSE